MYIYVKQTHARLPVYACMGGVTSEMSYACLCIIHVCTIYITVQLTCIAWRELIFCSTYTQLERYEVYNSPYTVMYDTWRPGNVQGNV